MSTVSISTVDILGVPVACEVLFSPQNTPRVEGLNLVLTSSKSVQTGSDGVASISLEAGEYTVRFLGLPLNQDTLTIAVPDDALTYSMIGLISSGVSPQPQPLFNLMGFSINVDGDLVPDGDLIPGGQFTLNEYGDLVPA